MANGDKEAKPLVEIVLMPLVIALVGIFGTYFITNMQEEHSRQASQAQLQSSEQLARTQIENAKLESESQKQLKLLEIVADRLFSKDRVEQEQAIHLIEALDGDLALRMNKAATKVVISQEARKLAESTLETRLITSVNVDPPTVAPGQMTTFTVRVYDLEKRPVPGATVTISAGGGRFLPSADTKFNPKDRLHGPYKATGETDGNGVFTTWWVCNPCAAGYGMQAEVSKSRYISTKTAFNVGIR